ncbi:hypothetical protein [Alkalihalobacillus sp. LMS39]|uniref:hypothetical protein n=1 Tax=Alkalihalobacillus sp. LMS39 TaxID=2924032 RepID=UPI001FB4E709|nr:hypothetical protein [Alkalihalobacillus sp. LMS39]UOE94779.1 hypothetical protein MM271_03795 [Alkalihalobacillus sp. LMS39]
MILKVYIKRNLFHLPRKQNDLTELIKEKFYKNKTLVKTAFQKLYSITEIENENIVVERNTNIFLLNLYLLVLQEKGELAFTEKVEFNDKVLLQKIEEKTRLNVLNDSIEDIEELVLNHLYPTEQKATKKERLLDTKDTSSRATFDHIDFSIEWIKKAHNKLNE